MSPVAGLTASGVGLPRLHELHLSVVFKSYGLLTHVSLDSFAYFKQLVQMIGKRLLCAKGVNDLDFLHYAPPETHPPSASVAVAPPNQREKSDSTSRVNFS